MTWGSTRAYNAVALRGQLTRSRVVRALPGPKHRSIWLPAEASMEQGWSHFLRRPGADNTKGLNAKGLT